MSFDPDSTPVPTPVTKKSMADELKERLENKPDPWTIRWLKMHIEEWNSKFSEVIRAYRGVCHTINIITSDIRDLIAGRRKQDERIDIIQSESEMTSAYTGRLNAELESHIEEYKAKMESLGRWATELERWAVKQGKPPTPKDPPQPKENSGVSPN